MVGKKPKQHTQLPDTELKKWLEIEEHVKSGTTTIVRFNDNTPICFSLYNGEKFDSNKIHVNAYKCYIHLNAWYDMTTQSQPTYIRCNGIPRKLENESQGFVIVSENVII